MSQVIKDYTHPLQKHFLPFTEDMNRNAVKLYFRLHSTHWVRSALAARPSNTQECKFTKRHEDQSTAGTTAMSESMAGGTFIELTGAVLCVFVSNHLAPAAGLRPLVGDMYSAVTRGWSGRGGEPSQ